MEEEDTVDPPRSLHDRGTQPTSKGSKAKLVPGKIHGNTAEMRLTMDEVNLLKLAAALSVNNKELSEQFEKMAESPQGVRLTEPMLEMYDKAKIVREEYMKELKGRVPSGNEVKE